MKLHIFLIALAVGLSLQAAADIETVVEAVETTTGNVNLPTSVNGRLSFKRCDGSCDEDYETVRLTPETRFVVGGEPVEFIDFRKAFFNLRRDSDNYALVSYDTESETVTSIRIGD